MVVKVLRGEFVLSLSSKSGAKGHCGHQFLGKQTEIEIVGRKLAERPWH